MWQHFYSPLIKINIYLCNNHENGNPQLKTLTTIFILLLGFFGSINIKAYTPARRSELSNLCVRAIGQDSYGYIWIATANGLCKSYGNEYDIFFGDKDDSQTVPSSSILGLFTDSDGWMMVATNTGVCALEKGTKTFHRFNLEDGTRHDFVSYGFIEYAGRLLCYGAGGLYELDKKSKRIDLRVRIDGESVKTAVKGPDNQLWISNETCMMGIDSTLKPTIKLEFDPNSHIRTLVRTDSGLLLGTPNGVLSFNTTDRTTSPTSVSDDTEVNHILTLDDGMQLIATGNRGVLVYDPKADSISHKYHNIDFNELQTNEITNVYYDRNKNIWVSTFDKGEVLMSDRPRIFNLNRQLIKSFRNEFVTRTIPDSNGNLWIGTRYNGIAFYDCKNGTRQYFNSQTSPALKSFSHDFVQEMTLDSDGHLWIGYNNSLIVCKPNISASGHIKLEMLKKFPFFVNVVSIAEDVAGQIWVGTDNSGLFIIDRNHNVVKRITTPLIQSNNITKIIPYDDNHMLIAAYTDNIYLIDIGRMAIHTIESSEGKAIDSAIDLMLDRDKKLWIGTYHNGLLHYDFSTQKLESCLGDHNFDIVGLSQDSHGDIWASSSYGLYRFNSKGKAINSYLKSEGLGGNQFHEKCVASMPGGNILFGGNAGIEEISPLTHLEKSPPISIVVRGLWQLPDYRPILSGESENRAEPSVGQITLNHKDNSINIEYFAVCYDRIGDIEYTYMLKGRDKDFIYNGNYTRVSYSDLSSGDYEFYVKARFKGGEWQEPVRLLSVTVTPNPWLSTTAIAIYLLLTLSIVFTINRSYLRFKLIKQKYLLSEERINQEKRTTENRINFFTNISHELRTPLTLICGPAKYLRANHKSMTDEQIKESIDFIDSNVDRLMTLINQLLRFRRVSNETLPLQVAKNDLASQLEALAKLYTFYATENRVTIQFERLTEENTQLTYDSDKVEKIISNLIINAVKYSTDNGTVKLMLDIVKHPAEFENDNDFTYAQISVVDNGLGMQEEDIPKIFQPFKRLLGIDGPKKTDGFGIGLNFVSHLVKEHKGVIRTMKNPTGGMTFTVILPVCDAAFSLSEFQPISPDIRVDNAASYIMTNDESSEKVCCDEPLDTINPDNDEADDIKPKILIIDDNSSLNSFISNIFNVNYSVIQAFNGQEGLQKATQECPDIIISDVLMPGDIDGFELCRQIKSDSSTSHIPVILLTAKILDEHKIQGYNCGADAYLCKPFSPDVLIARVNNLYNRRSQQATMILASAGMSEPGAHKETQEELSPLDKKFLEKLYAYIDNSLDNCDLNVNMLGRELGFSRTNFYRKVKALTGISPNDLLRVYRLNRAAELLLTREYTVGEVGERTGFGNQSHFSSLFKKHFGVSPRAYVTNHFSQCSVTIDQ
ncbi:two-component regulator propeller domain-containing protein [uncultured Duncaniella sp.]|uniref:hybrid sensor histidine kinase/response regulator transcription factor n=1 Tax=uncultured Duncaniella sp. TaxID=2768039 RepID=UPI002712060A|nr:two-component regulator propeller domain-containing protein [uncultured Duncaniella sp.]